MMKDISNFRIVEKANNQHLANKGNCALCGKRYLFGNRVIGEYTESGGYLITEPFNLCDKCFQKHDKTDKWHKQEKLTRYK